MSLCQTMAARYWPSSAVPTACAICEAESGGNPNAVGPVGERGLWQIYPAVWSSVYPGNLFDPDYNAQVAAAISHGGATWSDWTTYTSGAYLAHLGQCGGSSSPAFGLPGVPGGIGGIILGLAVIVGLAFLVED